MDTEDEPVRDLVALGLARYEARVYLALVRRESYTAAEVARAADVPRQRVYDVLDALVRRRLAVAHPGRVATFSAVAPELAKVSGQYLEDCHVAEITDHPDSAFGVTSRALDPETAERLWTASEEIVGQQFAF